MSIGKTATIVTSFNGDTSVKYHNTVVVRFNSVVVALDTGGYFTATTKRRMNEASKEFGLGFTVFQANGDWFVSRPGHPLLPFGTNEAVSFSRNTKVST